jgi:hypothetical protein
MNLVRRFLDPLKKKQSVDRGKSASRLESRPAMSTAVTNRKRGLRTADRIEAMLKLSTSQVQSGRYRVQLYRFLTDNLPLVSSCIWTWSRLAAAPGEFRVRSESTANTDRAEKVLRALSDRIVGGGDGQMGGMTSFLLDLFQGLFRDGHFGGFITVAADGSGIDRFVPIDVADLRLDDERHGLLILERDDGVVSLDRPDFCHLRLNEGPAAPLGRSVLQTVPFVAYVEQQLVDDMRRSSHNAGFHRLHVRITPPDRMSGEADSAYVNRINDYFDSTVKMIRSCEVDENPVTWDNVEIASIGPNSSQGQTNRWFMSHRAMVEEICSGANLAPFLLGYSFGETSSWASLKFDLVMRQVVTVQAQVAGLLKLLGDIELALRGVAGECDWVFNNDLSYRASESAGITSQRLESILKLHTAGLLDDDSAREKVRELL